MNPLSKINKPKNHFVEPIGISLLQQQKPMPTSKRVNLPNKSLSLFAAGYVTKVLACLLGCLHE